VTAQRDPIVAGSALVLTGDWLPIARKAALIADRARHYNGAPSDPAYLTLAKALTSAMSANMSECGRSVIAEAELLHAIPQQEQLTVNVTIADAARQLGLTERQTRRHAPRLGGKKIGGQWFLNQNAIDEHRRGQQ
jgi:hypothetical protein